MKNKFTDVMTCGLFCGFLALMLILFLALPKEDFSQLEKRALAAAPDTSAQAILSGEFGTQAESYVADHLPGRDVLVGTAAYYDLLSGRQATKDILPAANDRLVERPNVMNEAAIARNISSINRFAQSVGQQVDLMIVPSAGFVLEDQVLGLHDDYIDDAIISAIWQQADTQVRPVDLTAAFAGAQERSALFYRTDHHWTSRGAYTAYSAYMEVVGKPAKAESEFEKTVHPGFCGTTYSRSGLWLTKPDEVELWHSGSAITVTAYSNAADRVGVSHEGVFYTDRLSQQDMYTVFLDGNQPLVRVQNPEGEGRLLVIRDSYANCLGAFLAESYEEVVLVDLRYYKSPVSDLVKSQDFDQILVCYSLYNFLTDANFPWLK